jgi:predicted O-linked N-acetylglucosamine transferase (SPINDLY family)
VAHFLLPLLSSHDRAKCHTVCYAQIAEPDEVTARFRSIAGAWRDTARMSDAAVADMIRNDAIDILIDLSGHSADNRLLVFAHKAAPVQMTFLGYPATTGMTAIDYRLTDALADPADEYCSEQLIRLPRTAWCFTPLDEAPAVTESPATQNGFVTFGSFNNLAKINQPLIHTWAEILRLVPNSRLLVRAKGLASASRQQWLRETFHQAGVEPDRLELSGSVPWADRLTAYGRIDIALDTYPYHGTTTTCDALWMGVPVVAQAGKSHLSRVGVSLLSSVGHPQWIADGSKQYFTIAAGLAADVRRLSELRSSLRSQFKASPLFDSAAYARDVEAAYRTMWRAWCDQPSP